MGPKRSIPSHLVLWLVTVQIQPKVQDVRITTTEDVRTKGMTHLDRDEIPTKISDRIGTGNPIWQIASIGNHLEIKYREPRHPIGITVPHEMTTTSRSS